MKNFFKTVLFFCAIVSFVGCDSDNDSNSNSDTVEFIDSWEMVSLEASEVSTTNNQGQSVSSVSEIIAQNIDITIEFTENPEEFTAEGSFELLTATIIDGETILEENEIISDVSVSGAYNRDGDLIAFSNVFVFANTSAGDVMETGGILGLKVEELSSTTLILSLEGTTIEQEEDGETVTTSVNAQIVFTRL